MTLTKPEELKIKELIYKYGYIYGRKSDHRYKYPQGLEDVYIIRFSDKENINNPLNDRIGLLIAYTKHGDEPVVLFERNWIETTRDKLIYEARLNETYLQVRDEFLERIELQRKLKPITNDDIMDLYLELELMDNGILIFNKDLLNWRP